MRMHMRSMLESCLPTQANDCYEARHDIVLEASAIATGKIDLGALEPVQMIVHCTVCIQGD